MVNDLVRAFGESQETNATRFQVKTHELPSGKFDQTETRRYYARAKNTGTHPSESFNIRDILPKCAHYPEHKASVL